MPTGYDACRAYHPAGTAGGNPQDGPPGQRGPGCADVALSVSQGTSGSRLQPCCGAMPPEHIDGCRLVAKLTDRHGTRYVSALGDSRERSVPCLPCGQPTLALDGHCDRCAVEAGVRAITHLAPQAREVLLG